MKRELSTYIHLALLERDRIIEAADVMRASPFDQAAIDAWNVTCKIDPAVDAAFAAAKNAVLHLPTVMEELKAARAAQWSLIGNPDASWAMAMEEHAPPFNTLRETVNGIPDGQERVWTSAGVNAWTPARVTEKRENEILAMFPIATAGTRPERMGAIVCEVLGITPHKYNEMDAEEQLSVLERVAGWHHSKQASPATIELSNPTSPAQQQSTQIIETDLQRAIMAALDGQALTTEKLANKVSGGDTSRLYKPGGFKELRAVGLIKHKRQVGFYRPDAPPVGTGGFAKD